MAKGDDTRILIQLLQVLPEKIKVVEIMGDIMPDTEIMETLFCGKCGSPGYWSDIPFYMLEALGMIKSEPIDKNGNEKDISKGEKNIEAKKSKKKKINLNK